MVAWPILSGRASEVEEVSVSEKTQAYTTSKNLLLNGADAVERIMTSYKEVCSVCAWRDRTSVVSFLAVCVYIVYILQWSRVKLHIHAVCGTLSNSVTLWTEECECTSEMS